jgi:hypothetical protein
MNQRCTLDTLATRPEPRMPKLTSGKLAMKSHSFLQSAFDPHNKHSRSLFLAEQPQSSKQLTTAKSVDLYLLQTSSISQFQIFNSCRTKLRIQPCRLLGLVPSWPIYEWLDLLQGRNSC